MRQEAQDRDQHQHGDNQPPARNLSSTRTLHPNLSCGEALAVRRPIIGDAPPRGKAARQSKMRARARISASASTSTAATRIHPPVPAKRERGAAVAAGLVQVIAERAHDHGDRDHGRRIDAFRVGCHGPSPPVGCGRGGARVKRESLCGGPSEARQPEPDAPRAGGGGSLRPRKQSRGSWRRKSRVRAPRRSRPARRRRP